MIAYGPAEDPEIAIGIVVEYGGAGARTGTLVADIFNAYYAMKDGTLTVDEAAAESQAQPETAADAAETLRTARPTLPPGRQRMPGRTTQLRLRRMPQPRQARDDNARISVEIGETPEKIGAFVQKPVVKREKL